MHNAPSVNYPAGRSLLAGALAAALWLLGALVTVGWFLEAQVNGWRLAAAVTILALAGLATGWNWWSMPRGTLGWDGQGWTWSCAGQSDSGWVGVRLDLQHWLLLRFGSQGASRWLWLERSRSAGLWDDLRRAVYSRARPQTPPAAGAQAAEP